jgi:hypothetical protein
LTGPDPYVLAGTAGSLFALWRDWAATVDFIA